VLDYIKGRVTWYFLFDIIEKACLNSESYNYKILKEQISKERSRRERKLSDRFLMI
jgi:hypothetical protein